MKLLVLDVEGTLFRLAPRLPGAQVASTIWQAIARALGPEAVAEEVATHRKWAAKQYRHTLDWARDTIAIHKKYGLTRSLFGELVASVDYNPGVRETLLAIDRREYVPVLITGGFRALAERAQIDLQIHHAFAACDYFFGLDGTIVGFNLVPCDFDGKIDFVRLMLHEYGLTERDWIYIGDGSNDVGIAKAAPLSIAYAGSPELRAVATRSIEDFRELGAILREAALLESSRG